MIEQHMDMQPKAALLFQSIQQYINRKTDKLILQKMQAASLTQAYKIMSNPGANKKRLLYWRAIDEAISQRLKTLDH